jgi:hypothetical protein
MGKMIFHRNRIPIATPDIASAMAAYPIPMSLFFAAIDFSVRKNYVTTNKEELH